MAQEILIAALQDLSSTVLSFPTYVHIFLVTTLERLLVLLSLVLNAYVCILFVKTWKWPEKEKGPNEERIMAIEKFICEHSKILKATDIEKGSNDETNWLLPKPGTSVEMSQDQEDKNNLRSVKDDECAICMNQYTPGDRITWSSNQNCIHCFHSECLRAWLLPSETRNQLCPCCRQPYCSETDH